MQTRKHYYHDVSMGDGGYCHTCEVTKPEGETWVLPVEARKMLLPEHIREADHVLIDSDEGDEGPIWSTADDALVDGTFSTDELATAKVLECVIDLDTNLGHYITAQWLRRAADLLEGLQVNNPYRFDRPETFRLRDRVQNAIWDAREAAETYYDSDGNPNVGEAVFHIADHYMEPLLAKLGYVTQSGDMGYQTFRIIEGETT